MIPAIFHQLPASKPHAYVQRKTWIIRCDLLKLSGTGFMHTLRTLPGLHNRRLFGLWRDSFFHRVENIDLPYGYDALQINEGGFRLRAFDILDGKTTKIVRRDSRYGESTLRELVAREGFLKKSSLKIPQIYEHMQDDIYIRFSEEMLKGRAFRHWIDAPRFMRDVGGPMLTLCEDYGVTDKPLSESMDADKVAKIMHCPAGDPRIAPAQNLLERNPIVATSIAHCDLVCSNMIVTKRGIYVIDWEKCKEMYAGYDFARLALRYPHNPFFVRPGREALARFQGNRLRLADVKILRDAILASHSFSTP